MMESQEVLILNIKSSILVLFLFLCFALIIAGCDGRDGTKPKPPEEIADPTPPPIVNPIPPDNGTGPTPSDNDYRHLCDLGNKQPGEYHYDDGSEKSKFLYYNCTYYAAKEFQKIAPEPGVNWGGDAGAWYKNAGEHGWITTNIQDDSRLVPGSIIVWGNHVQIVRAVFKEGIVVQGMNEAWANLHDPIDVKHKKHLLGGYSAYTGYVYKYCIPFNDFDKQTQYWGGPFQGYILPIRQSGDALGIQSQAPFTYDEIELESLGILVGMGKEQILAKLGQPLRVERSEDIYGSEVIELSYDEFSIWLYNGSYSGYTIYSRGVSGIRDIQVGDNVEKVLASFLKTNDIPGIWKNPDAVYWSSITSNCVELYFIDTEEGPVLSGSYHCDERSGEIISIGYSDYIPSSCAHSGVTFYIEKGLVKKISCGY